jgi:hypothetical protein
MDMLNNQRSIYPRDIIPIGGFVLMLGLLALDETVAIAAFLICQLLTGLDVILLVLGRFSPRLTLLGIRVERFLGPLPWKRK